MEKYKYNKENESLEPSEIIKSLLIQLPKLANTLIDDRPENNNFRKNPDDPKEHNTTWHQFGIITHTKQFIRFFQNEAQKYFQEWNINEKIEQKLHEKINGKTKKELLEISIVFHDLGKFIRDFKEKNGEKKPNYKGHEQKSKKLITNNKKINDLLKSYDLTDKQINYIANCAGLHYELGKIRNKAKKTKLGYTIAFTKSKQFKESCEEIAKQFPDFKVEIGILFLCDNLAKTDTDMIIKAKTDAEIEKQTPQIEKMIQARQLNPNLIKAIKQIPINVEIARIYLENIFKK